MSDIENRILQISNLLDDSKSRITEIEGLLLVTRDGLPIAATELSETTDEDRMSAMTAASLNLAERVVLELAKGELKEMIIKGDNGLVIIIQAGEEAVLTATTATDAKLGLLLLELKRTAKAVTKLLGE
ncbi:MAG: roadblock/LC7 domain-containing protein [Candidatus Hodarchaeales archaeon]